MFWISILGFINFLLGIDKINSMRKSSILQVAQKGSARAARLCRAFEEVPDWEPNRRAPFRGFLSDSLRASPRKIGIADRPEADQKQGARNPTASEWMPPRELAKAEREE